MTTTNQRFIVLINGNPIAYAKRVRPTMGSGYPAVTFVGGRYPNGCKSTEPETYTERVAKGWVTTLSKRFDNVTMEPAKF